MGEIPAKADLFRAIGMFLAEHRLSCEPTNFAFAHQVLSEPRGPLALSVARITDSGVRLTGQDIADLGGRAVAGAPLASDAASPDSNDFGLQAEALIALAEMQVSGFSDTVRSIHAETSGFGRDLAASAAAMEQAGSSADLGEIARLTAAMLDVVHAAERRLADAQREAEVLRHALDEARGSARQDPLTELANRRAFDEAYDALPADAPVALAVCDIDHFKRVNDNFGHAVGDRVLRAIGQTLAAEVGGALVARYGGEEFAVLMIDVDLDAAVAAIDQARVAIAARRFRSRETNAPIGAVTISGGVAVGTAADQREALYARADAALYCAKVAGRNRVSRAE